MTNIDEKELDNLIHDMFDPGCEITTKIFNLLPTPENELYAPAMLAINAHKDSHEPHNPDCFVNRKIN